MAQDKSGSNYLVQSSYHYIAKTNVCIYVLYWRIKVIWNKNEKIEKQKFEKLSH